MRVNHIRCFNYCWDGTDFSVNSRFWYKKPRFLQFHNTGSGTSVLVPTSRYQGFGTRFSWDYLHFSDFGTSSVPYQFHFGSK